MSDKARDEISRGKLQGACVAVFGQGVLITGASGAGKTECALELVNRGHRLVSDDVVEIARGRSGLSAHTVRNLSYHVHVRDVGIVDVEEIYGSDCVQAEVPLLLRAELVRPLGDEDVMLGDEEARCDLFGVALPEFKIRAFPGRNMALAVEIAVRHELARRRGSAVSRRFENRPLRLVPTPPDLYESGSRESRSAQVISKD